MNQDILKLLKYSKSRLKGPFNPNYPERVYLDGVYNPSSEELIKCFEKNIEDIKEWEFFKNNIDKAIKDGEQCEKDAGLI